VKISGPDLRLRLLPILAAQAVGLLCGIAGVRLTSRFVDPADYGAYGIFMSLAPLGPYVVFAGVVRFLARHWQDSPARPALLRAVLVAALRKTPWLAGAAAVAGVILSPDEPVRYAALLFGGAFLAGLTQLAQAALQAARDHWRDFAVAGAASIARSFGPPLLYAATGAGLLALQAGYVVHALVGAGLGAVVLWRWAGSAAPAPASVALPPTYEGTQFMLLAVAAWVAQAVNRWAVAWAHGAEPAGYFTLAGNVGLILPTILAAVLGQFRQPHWYATDTGDPAALARLRRDVDRVAAGFTAGALVLSALLHLAMPRLIGPLVDARYLPAVDYVFATGAATTALLVAGYFHTLLIAARREDACLVPDLTGGVVFFAGSLAAAGTGLAVFKTWLALSPLVPWVVNRTLAHRALARPR